MVSEPIRGLTKLAPSSRYMCVRHIEVLTGIHIIALINLKFI